MSDCNKISTITDLLRNYPQGSELVNHEGQNFVHISMLDGNKVVLSTERPIGACHDCGNSVFKTTVSDYDGVCPSCDINLYSFEIEPLPIKESEEDETC